VIDPELEDAFGRAQVLQPVQAEITDIGAGEVSGRLREQHLAAVARRGDPSRPVHVQADVILAVRQRLPCVQAHPHLHRAARQCALCSSGGRDGRGGARERDEEGVALGVDFDSVMLAPCLAEDAVMLGEHRRVPIAELLQQPRGPLDIGEEERHRAGRKLAQHRPILPGPGPHDQPTVDAGE
jgi:hypothetical protein